MQPNDGLPKSPQSGLSRRDQILSIAAELFAARGYDGTSMQDIGQRVGLLKGSLYAHVASKEEILLEILSTADRRLYDALQRAIGSRQPAADRLLAALRGYLDTIHDLGAYAHVYLLETRRLSGQPAEWMRQARARQQVLWQRLIDQGIASGAYRTDLDAQLAAWLPAAALWYAQQEEPADAEFAERLTQLLLEGYR